jgi:16S rRNA (guanine966-N2)-methyltransferase
MRVITGQAKGRKLEAPPGKAVRPTSDRIKEAMFSIVSFDVEQSSVADLFAGTGQLGIEALSRGARSVVFVDNCREAVECIRTNLSNTKLWENAKVAQGSCLSFLKGGDELFDIAFLDPPFEKNTLLSVLDALATRMQPGGIVVCETEKAAQLPEAVGHLTSKREYKYGKTKLTVYRQGEDL